MKAIYLTFTHSLSAPDSENQDLEVFYHNLTSISSSPYSIANSMFLTHIGSMDIIRVVSDCTALYRPMNPYL